MKRTLSSSNLSSAASPSLDLYTQTCLNNLFNGNVDIYIMFDPFEGDRGAPFIDYGKVFWDIFGEYEDAENTSNERGLAPTEAEYNAKDMGRYMTRLSALLKDAQPDEFTKDQYDELSAYVTEYTKRIRRYHAFKQDVLRDQSDFESHLQMMYERREAKRAKQ